LRAGDLPAGSDQPSAEAADRAVSVVIYGNRAQVNIASAVASGDGSHSVSVDAGVRGGRSRIKAVVYGLVSVATIVAALVAIAQWQGWNF